MPSAHKLTGRPSTSQCWLQSLALNIEDDTCSLVDRAIEMAGTSPLDVPIPVMAGEFHLERLRSSWLNYLLLSCMNK